MQDTTLSDILIIGAGVAGIGTACHLLRSFPDMDVRLVERRQAIGGTWDLFRYPGVRSDSDMCTYGYDFRPWSRPDMLADGQAIQRYITDTAREEGIDQRIWFGTECVSAHWLSAQGFWRLSLRNVVTGQLCDHTCRFLICGSGYYNYDQGYLPDIEGLSDFRGTVIHPQHWPQDLDWTDKRVVVVGSGATAVTLVPSLAERAAHVTMLQRSPTYMLALPGRSRLATFLQAFLPERVAVNWMRRRNIFGASLIYGFARRFPRLMRALLLRGVSRALRGRSQLSHFTPSYQPWDQRLCIVKDGDLFSAVRSGRASVVTDHIRRFTPEGIELTSGQVLAADVVVCATGLQLQAFGGMQLLVDGQAVQLGERMTYKAVLLQDVPNFAWMFGYINASWTMKTDLAAHYLCRLLRWMRDQGRTVVTPRAQGASPGEGNVFSDLNAGYVRRAARDLPRQGRTLPWRVLHNYAQDKKLLLEDSVADGALELTGQLMR